MMHTTTHYRTAKRERLLKPVFGAAAVFAALATRSEAAPMEVAILPGTIEVVAKRTKVAARSQSSGYLPATYKVR